MPARKLVIHIITRLEPGGSSRNTIDSCSAQAAVYNVILLAGPHKNSATLLKLLPPSVQYIEISDLQRELNPVKDLKAFLALKKDLERLQPDIIHTHTSKAGALGRLAAAIAGRGTTKAIVIHTPHGHLLYGYYGPLKTFLFRFAEGLLSKFTGYLIALTRGEMNESAAAGIGRPQQWEVIHSGVSLQTSGALTQKKDLGIAEDEIVIGTVARLEPVKGVEYLLRAAVILKEKFPAARLRYLVVGSGELKISLEKLASKLGIHDMVMFTGFRQNGAALMGAMDIYVQPSLNEAMGRAPLEAQAMGLPVVVSRVCGLPDIIAEGKTGIAVKAGDPEALAAALERLFLSKKLRERMGQAAKEWTGMADTTGFPRFGAESMNAQLLALYTRALGKTAA
ncbi:MAG: hypothetical protein A2234_08100 [Elusimicrobia bacterium RIFOXYA2_FULL_58_8]|nr:MAG: hypothetical protein A2234_08100 [Elusimicrobia bacterium RIFOXYA2_FULL_58_8]OGS13343.1 MAG: hypothetical protein A2285_02920 [Elusimicrobia bacterium RIFOXYA12_FULL_57_11]